MEIEELEMYFKMYFKLTKLGIIFCLILSLYYVLYIIIGDIKLAKRLRKPFLSIVKDDCSWLVYGIALVAIFSIFLILSIFL